MIVGGNLGSMQTNRSIYPITGESFLHLDSKSKCELGRYQRSLKPKIKITEINIYLSTITLSASAFKFPIKTYKSKVAEWINGIHLFTTYKKEKKDNQWLKVF